MLDFETTNLEFGSPLNNLNRLILACWNFCGKRRSKFGDENDQRELVEDIKRADFIVAHNGKFELGWLRRIGIDLRGILCYDTMLAEWVLLGNQRDTGLSLEASCQRRGVKGKYDRISHLIKNGVPTEAIPKDWLEEYCHDDVTATKALFEVQLKLLRESNRLHLAYQRGLVAACLTDIEFAGIALDADRVNDEYQSVLAEYHATTQELYAFGEINWRSGKQVRELVYGQLGFAVPKDGRGKAFETARGDPQVNKAAFESLKATSKKQERFLELYKKQANLNAKLTKNLEFFYGICKDYGGIFYGSINQGRTGTHRLSSSGRPVLLRIPSEQGVFEDERGVQLQNIPRDYKRLFRAKREGWLLLEADGCFAKGSKVLLKDGKEISVEDIVVGDELLGFDEFANGQGKDRTGQIAVVEAVQRRQAECIKLNLGNKEIVVSKEHPFLARIKHKRVWEWMSADKILKLKASGRNVQLRRFQIPSLTGTERDKGKLSAYLDGEGNWAWDKCSISQQVGSDVFLDIADTLLACSIPHTTYNYRMSDLSTKKVASFTVTGTRNLLAIQREICPVKSQRDVTLVWKGKYLTCDTLFEVTSAEYVGKADVYSIQTSTRTYIAEELFNHNCQLEFRVGADLGNDPIAEQDIKNGTDIHSITAATLSAAGEPTNRQEAKSRTFRPLYGGRSGTKAEIEYCAFFQKKYHKLYKTQTNWTNQVLASKNGELITPYGLRFYWPGTKISRSGYIDNTTSIFNYPIQGLATAEIIPLALICFWHRTRNLRLELINTIHDSIVAEVHPDDVKEATETAVTCLTSDVYFLLDKLYNYKFHIPLGCEIKVGEYWGEGKGLKFESNPSEV